MSRQQRSGTPPRTIPAFAHLPEGGIETSVSVNADRTALKSILLFEENAPMTFFPKSDNWILTSSGIPHFSYDPDCVKEQTGLFPGKAVAVPDL